MKFILLKASDWKVEKINENDWTIKSPDGMYKNENGKEYHFKTKEDALEELDYLRAEHKFDKKSSSKKVTSKLDSGKWYKINGNPLSLQFTGETTRSGNLIFVKADGTQVVLDPSVEKLAEEFDYEKHNKIASKKVKSGESYGWYVDAGEAWDKLQLWIDTVGAEAALDDIAHAMGTDELSECLAFIFRNNDFKEGCSDYEEEEDE